MIDSSMTSLADQTLFLISTPLNPAVPITSAISKSWMWWSKWKAKGKANTNSNKKFGLIGLIVFVVRRRWRRRTKKRRYFLKRRPCGLLILPTWLAIPRIPWTAAIQAAWFLLFWMRWAPCPLNVFYTFEGNRWRWRGFCKYRLA